MQHVEETSFHHVQNVKTKSIMSRMQEAFHIKDDYLSMMLHIKRAGLHQYLVQVGGKKP